MTGEAIGWEAWLALGLDGEKERVDAIRMATMTGKPCGGAGFVAELERRLGRDFSRKKPGPKPREQKDDEQQLDLF